MKVDRLTGTFSWLLITLGPALAIALTIKRARYPENHERLPVGELNFNDRTYFLKPDLPRF